MQLWNLGLELIFTSTQVAPKCILDNLNRMYELMIISGNSGHSYTVEARRQRLQKSFNSWRLYHAVVTSTPLITPSRSGIARSNLFDIVRLKLFEAFSNAAKMTSVSRSVCRIVELHVPDCFSITPETIPPNLFAKDRLADRVLDVLDPGCECWPQNGKVFPLLHWCHIWSLGRWRAKQSVKANCQQRRMRQMLGAWSSLHRVTMQRHALARRLLPGSWARWRQGVGDSELQVIWW